jgi:hypothetical protein
LEDKNAVFKMWETSSEEEWKTRVRNCLNFISGQDFKSLEEASLMHRVHEELREAIEHYNPSV